MIEVRTESGRWDGFVDQIKAFLAADLIDLNASYFAAASRAGDDVELLELSGADHLDVIDSHSEHWAAIVNRLREMIPPSNSATN